VGVGRDESDATRFWDMVMDAMRDSGAITPADALTTPMPAPLGGQEEFLRHLQEGSGRPPQTVLLVLDDLHQLRSDNALGGLPQAVGSRCSRRTSWNRLKGGDHAFRPPRFRSWPDTSASVRAS
jgi:hypothetical protein